METTTKIQQIKDIVGYEHLYTISSCGIVIAKSRKITGAVIGMTKPKKISITDNGAGYKIASLSNNGRKNHYIHRLVANHFIPNPLELKEVNHIDGNKSNNHISNLEWVNRSQNLKHCYKLGLRKMTKEHQEKIQMGKKCVKISIDEASEICEAYATGLFSQRGLAETTGVSQSRIMNLVNGKKIILSK